MKYKLKLYSMFGEEEDELKFTKIIDSEFIIKISTDDKYEEIRMHENHNPDATHLDLSNQDQKDMVESVKWEKEFDEKFLFFDLYPAEKRETKSFIRTLLAETRKETIENKGKEIKKAEQAMAKEKNLNQISFYEGYIKGLKYDH